MKNSRGMSCRPTGPGISEKMIVATGNVTSESQHTQGQRHKERKERNEKDRVWVRMINDNRRRRDGLRNIGDANRVLPYIGPVNISDGTFSFVAKSSTMIGTRISRRPSSSG